MSVFDGSPLPLGYGEALVEVARLAPWNHEGHRDAVIEAIQREHGLYIVPEAKTREEEIQRLRLLAAEQDAREAEAAQEAELAALREKLGITTPADAAGDDETKEA